MERLKGLAMCAAAIVGAVIAMVQAMAIPLGDAILRVSALVGLGVLVALFQWWRGEPIDAEDEHGRPIKARTRKPLADYLDPPSDRR